jgi:SAM-dependent methyltransferase
MDELEEIRARYARRATEGADPYSLQNVDAFLALEQRDSHIHRNLLKSALDFSSARILEVGCGSGMNLLRFLAWGFAPEHLAGVELLHARCEEARRNLPQDVMLVEGDAATIQFPDLYDVVLQSTVFSSILQPEMRRAVAANMWRHTSPGGLIISYDLAVNNPKNRDVRRLGGQEFARLFPGSVALSRKRLTLAPPIGRRVSHSRWGYRALALAPFLRSHRLMVLRKPPVRTDAES